MIRPHQEQTLLERSKHNASQRPGGGGVLQRGSVGGKGDTSSRAATPGRTLPSSSSREAPPPVEMWLILSARPAFSTAATESPPPMIVMAPYTKPHQHCETTVCGIISQPDEHGTTYNHDLH